MAKTRSKGSRPAKAGAGAEAGESTGSAAGAAAETGTGTGPGQTRNDSNEISVAFSGGGIRSSALCSGVLCWLGSHGMLRDPHLPVAQGGEAGGTGADADAGEEVKAANKVPHVSDVSCVSGGGYTGSSYVLWRKSEGANGNGNGTGRGAWFWRYLDTLSDNAGYMIRFTRGWHLAIVDSAAMLAAVAVFAVVTVVDVSSLAVVVSEGVHNALDLPGITGLPTLTDAVRAAGPTCEWALSSSGSESVGNSSLAGGAAAPAGAVVAGTVTAATAPVGDGEMIRALGCQLHLLLTNIDWALLLLLPMVVMLLLTLLMTIVRYKGTGVWEGTPVKLADTPQDPIEGVVRAAKEAAKRPAKEATRGTGGTRGNMWAALRGVLRVSFVGKRARAMPQVSQGAARPKGGADGPLPSTVALAAALAPFLVALAARAFAAVSPSSAARWEHATTVYALGVPMLTSLVAVAVLATVSRYELDRLAVVVSLYVSAFCAVAGFGSPLAVLGGGGVGGLEALLYWLCSACFVGAAHAGNPLRWHRKGGYIVAAALAAWTALTALLRWPDIDMRTTVAHAAVTVAYAAVYISRYLHSCCCRAKSGESAGKRGEHADRAKMVDPVLTALLLSYVGAQQPFVAVPAVHGAPTAVALAAFVVACVLRWRLAPLMSLSHTWAAVGGVLRVARFVVGVAMGTAIAHSVAHLVEPHTGYITLAAAVLLGSMAVSSFFGQSFAAIVIAQAAVGVMLRARAQVDAPLTLGHAIDAAMAAAEAVCTRCGYTTAAASGGAASGGGSAAGAATAAAAAAAGPLAEVMVYLRGCTLLRLALLVRVVSAVGDRAFGVSLARVRNEWWGDFDEWRLVRAFYPRGSGSDFSSSNGNGSDFSSSSGSGNGNGNGNGSGNGSGSGSGNGNGKTSSRGQHDSESLRWYCVGSRSPFARHLCCCCARASVSMRPPRMGDLMGDVPRYHACVTAHDWCLDNTVTVTAAGDSPEVSTTFGRGEVRDSVPVAVTAHGYTRLDSARTRTTGYALAAGHGGGAPQGAALVWPGKTGAATDASDDVTVPCSNSALPVSAAMAISAAALANKVGNAESSAFDKVKNLVRTGGLGWGKWVRPNKQAGDNTSVGDRVLWVWYELLPPLLLLLVVEATSADEQGVPWLQDLLPSAGVDERRALRRDTWRVWLAWAVLDVLSVPLRSHLVTDTISKFVRAVMPMERFVRKSRDALRAAAADAVTDVIGADTGTAIGLTAAPVLEDHFLLHGGDSRAAVASEATEPLSVSLGPADSASAAAVLTSLLHEATLLAVLALVALLAGGLAWVARAFGVAGRSRLPGRDGDDSSWGWGDTEAWARVAGVAVCVHAAGSAAAYLHHRLRHRDRLDSDLRQPLRRHAGMRAITAALHAPKPSPAALTAAVKQAPPDLGLHLRRARAFGVGDASSVYLSDGGHSENLAALPLLRARKTRILVVDGGQDGQETCADLVRLLDMARRDLRCDFFVPGDGGSGSAGAGEGDVMRYIDAQMVDNRVNRAVLLRVRYRDFEDSVASARATPAVRLARQWALTEALEDLLVWQAATRLLLQPATCCGFRSPRVSTPEPDPIVEKIAEHVVDVDAGTPALREFALALARDHARCDKAARRLISSPDNALAEDGDGFLSGIDTEEDADAVTDALSNVVRDLLKEVQDEPPTRHAAPKYTWGWLGYVKARVDVTGNDAKHAPQWWLDATASASGGSKADGVGVEPSSQHYSAVHGDTFANPATLAAAGDASTDPTKALHGMCCARCHRPWGWWAFVSTTLLGLGKFPQHATSNQFFTPHMHNAYHTQGYRAMQWLFDADGRAKPNGVGFFSQKERNAITSLDGTAPRKEGSSTESGAGAGAGDAGAGVDSLFLLACALVAAAGVAVWAVLGRNACGDCVGWLAWRAVSVGVPIVAVSAAALAALIAFSDSHVDGTRRLLRVGAALVTVLAAWPQVGRGAVDDEREVCKVSAALLLYVCVLYLCSRP